MAERMDENPGPPQVPGYEIVGTLGRGGMGEVFVARQVALGRLVAIKCLKPDCGSATTERFMRFRREAELMARVNHPNVLSAFDFGTVEERPYLVMEYVEAGDLRQLMIPGEAMPLVRTMSILRPVGDALQCLHRHGILHRDLKPENVLLHDDGHPKVADFGIAVLRTGGGEATGTRVGLGTPGYVAPEQQFGLKVDERADQYSLAALAYEMLTGQVPLGVIRPPSRLNPRLTASIDEVWMRALQEDPDDRYPTMHEFCKALDQAAQDGRVKGKSKAWRGVAAASVALMGVGLGLGVWYVWPKVQDAPALAPRDAGKLAPPAPGEVSRPARPPDSLAILLEKQVDLRAYRIWVANGQPQGTEQSDWLAALNDLLGNGPLAKSIRDRIDQRAYAIWEGAGKPQGTALDDWLAAKQQFLAENGFAAAIEDQLKDRAYARWIELGKPKGRDAQNWFEARRSAVYDGTLLPRQIENDLQMKLVLVDCKKTDVKEPVFLGAHEVTVGQFHEFVTETRRGSQRWDDPGLVDENQPVVDVSWDDARAFCAWLSAREGVTYRLPTELEWERACRAGCGRECRSGEAAGLEAIAWFRNNSEGRVHEVGTRRPDGLGLHDMHGNVGEWCLGTCEGAEGRRPLRGGCRLSPADEMRAESRQCAEATRRDPGVGFRVCREIAEALEADPSVLAEGPH